MVSKVARAEGFGLNIRRMMIAAAITAAVTAGIGLYLQDAIVSAASAPAFSSNESRWYSLEELGMKDLGAAAEKAIHGTTDPNRRAIRVLAGPYVGLGSGAVLELTEPWEHGSESGNDHPGYPSLVHNVHGKSADGKYYLYYSIHDAPAGIAVAVASDPLAAFVKLRDGQATRLDSRVLRAPLRPRVTSHFSSPVVLWNEAEKKWFMYFHFYSNEWDAGRGHQRTAVATTDSLASHRWNIWRGKDGGLVGVLPAGSAEWISSQSSYHSIHAFDGPLWIAFLRGTGGATVDGRWQQPPTSLGIAVSPDGRRWAMLPGNPRFRYPDSAPGNQRPRTVFISGDDLVFCWTDADATDSVQSLRCAATRDLVRFERVPPPFEVGEVGDGAFSLWPAGGDLLLFDGDRRTQLRDPKLPEHPKR